MQISGEDYELQELIDAYDITLPSVRVFRRGIMADYRGPSDPVGMAKYIIEDAKVSELSVTYVINRISTFFVNLLLDIASWFNSHP